MKMTNKPGTYALILRSKVKKNIEVGKWGTLEVVQGYYAYIGSAFGPGGILARVSRHCRVSKKNHWHIDYLREVLFLETVWYSHSTSRLEHVWAKALLNIDEAKPLTRFGCSDCQCKSHLFYFNQQPILSQLEEQTGSDILLWRSGDAETI